MSGPQQFPSGDTESWPEGGYLAGKPMSAPTANADRHTVTLPLPFDALPPLLIFIATEMRDGGHGHLAVALDDLASAQWFEKAAAESGVSYDAACEELDAALQAVEHLLPGVTWELPAADAANLGFALVDAGEAAGIAGWCAHCARAVPLGSGIPYDGTDLVWCGADCEADAAERRQAS